MSASALARAATREDAILGVQPEIVYEPSTVPEAAEVIGDSARAGRTLAFVGGGTDLELGGAPARFDAVLRTGGFRRVVEHAPSDQIAVVEAGCPLAALQERLAQSGQRLAIDPPLAERATVGGLIAANAFGPRRARFGSLKDLIIGVSLVRADGTLARGGGKVVKNVAGFDLPKLMVGSLGTLGLIATATFRLHPLPEAETTLLLTRRTARSVRGLVALIRKAQLEPVSVVAFWREADRFDVAVRFEGFGAGVVEQRERLTELIRGEPGSGCETLDLSAARELWARHDELRTAAPLRAKVAALPTSIETIAGTILPRLAAPFASPAFLWYATLGLGFFSGQPSDADEASAAVSAARSRLEEQGASLTLHAAPNEIRQRVTAWGAPPPALVLMRNVKDRLDPEHRLAPGRFVGGI